MEYISKLFSEVNVFTIITGIILIGASLKFVIELFEWIFKKFGIESKRAREKHGEHDLLIETVNKVDKLINHVETISENQEILKQKIDTIEEENIKYRQSDTRNEIIKLFRYFCDTHSNPTKAWTRVEHDSFMQLYEVYSSNKGNSYVHDEIYPTMQSLNIIEINEAQKLAELYSSRSQQKG